MIEINLSPRKKDNNLENLGGFNLSLLNVRLVVFSFVILYGIEPFVQDYFVEEIKAKDAAIAKIKKEQQTISTKLKELEDVKRQVEELNEQEASLAKKIGVVKKIVDKRQNPYKVLKYIAENIPSDVWLTTLELDDKALTMRGYSKSWKNIGEFLQNLKASIFFDPSMSFDKPDGAENEYKGQRVEAFEIKTNIVRFE